MVRGVRGVDNDIHSGIGRPRGGGVCSIRSKIGADGVANIAEMRPLPPLWGLHPPDGLIALCRMYPWYVTRGMVTHAQDAAHGGRPFDFESVRQQQVDFDMALFAAGCVFKIANYCLSL